MAQAKRFFLIRRELTLGGLPQLKQSFGFTAFRFLGFDPRLKHTKNILQGTLRYTESFEIDYSPP